MDKEARELFRGFIRSVYGDESANNDEFVQAQLDGLRREYQKPVVSVAEIKKLIQVEVSANKFAEVFKKHNPSIYTEVFFRPAPSKYGDHTRFVSQAPIPFTKGNLSADDCRSMFGAMPYDSMLGLYKRTDGLLFLWVQYDNVMSTDKEADREFDQMVNLDLAKAKNVARRRAMDFWEENDPMVLDTDIPEGIYRFLKGISMSYLGELGTHGKIEDDIRPDFKVGIFDNMIRYDIITSPLYGFLLHGDDVPFIMQYAPYDFEISLTPVEGEGFMVSISVPIK